MLLYSSIILGFDISVFLSLSQLFTDRCPKTCENFKSLCIGDKIESKRRPSAPLQLSFKDSIFHRIVPNGWIQGGGKKTR